MRAFDLGWAAGLIDGEGCFSVYAAPKKRTISIRLLIRVVLSDLPNNVVALRKLQRLFGGTIRERKKQKSWKPGAREQRVWGVFEKASIEAAKKLLPFLVIKRRTASVFLRIARLREKKNENLRRILELRDGLNHRPETRHRNYRTASMLLDGVVC